MKRILLLGCLFFLATPALNAQFFSADPVQRFELGQRLRLLEQALETQNDEKARKRVLPSLEKAVKAFFSNHLGTAAGLLDEARLALGDKPTDDTIWAESLIVKPGTRLIDPTSGELALRVESFYKVASKKPDKVSLRFTLAGQSSTVEVKEVPLSATVSVKGVKEGDHVLRAEILVEGKVRAVSEQTISVVEKLADRLAAIEKKIESAKEKPASVERTTLASLSKTLRDLAAKKTLETNFPATRLLKEAEELADALDAGKKVYGPDRPGQFWLTLGTDAVRVQIPKGLKKDKPVPLVVALHGAGGSENMFFDGYGGKIAKLCAERGWLLVATRAGLFPLGNSLDVGRVVDALARVYPVEAKKVFLVGHSLGASQAMSAVGKQPDRFAAVAALGGGGAFRNSDKLAGVSFFIGCGDRDLLLAGAKTLRSNLEKAKVKKVVYKEYQHVEHLAIVQFALADVFAHFDEVGKR